MTVHTTKLFLLCTLIALTTASCSFVFPHRDIRLDRRGEVPVARPIDSSSSGPPGAVPVALSDLGGAWFNRQTIQDAQLEIGGTVPWLFHALWLWLWDDGTYDLVYQTYWGSRANHPQRRAIDVRESGRFSLAGGRLSLEPNVTRQLEVRGGKRQRRTPNNDPRTYKARVDGGFLNLAGRCATYQVEPVCHRPHDVWFSLRSVSTDSPDEVPEL